MDSKRSERSSTLRAILSSSFWRLPSPIERKREKGFSLSLLSLAGSRTCLFFPSNHQLFLGFVDLDLSSVDIRVGSALCSSLGSAPSCEAAVSSFFDESAGSFSLVFESSLSFVSDSFSPVTGLVSSAAEALSFFLCIVTFVSPFYRRLLVWLKLLNQNIIATMSARFD